MSHLTKFREALAAKGYDAAIVSAPYNQRYFSDFPFDDGLVLVTKGKSYLITDFRYAEAAKTQASRELTVLIPEKGQLAAVAELLDENGCRNVATEDETLSCAAFARWQKALKDYSLTGGASELLTALRVYKDEGEIAKIAEAQKITDAAFEHILKVLHPDMTEIDVAIELENFMRRQGAEGTAFQTIAVSGTNSARPHGVPRPVRLEKGFLTMDYGAKVDGYCSDMTRTVVLGKADAEMKKVYQTVLKAQKEALAAAKEGASCQGLDKIARDIINNAGYAGCFGHSLGHGVGLLIHESPRLSTGAGDGKLERGHVVTFEPGIYLEGRYGCRIEDMAAVRADGTILDFTHSPKEMIELF